MYIHVMAFDTILFENIFTNGREKSFNTYIQVVPKVSTKFYEVGQNS